MKIEELDKLENPEIAELIDRFVRGERARAILKRQLIDEVPYEKLAEEFELSVSQFKRILYKAKSQFYSHFDDPKMN